MVKKNVLIAVLIGFIFSHNINSQNNNKVHNDSEEIVTPLSSMPEFKSKGKGDYRELFKFIIENVREVNIPENSSSVIVQFRVDTLGYTSNHRVIRSVNPELENEALRISGLLKFDKPAMQGTKSVAIIYTLPFDFRKILSDKQKAEKNKKRKRSEK